MVKDILEELKKEDIRLETEVYKGSVVVDLVTATAIAGVAVVAILVVVVVDVVHKCLRKILN